MTPPPLSTRLLRLAVSRDDAEHVVQELEYLYDVRVERWGKERADAWYRREVTAYVLSVGGDAAGSKLHHLGQTIGGIMSDLARDVGRALRALRRYPAFTAVVVLTLGLGIGGTTAVFGLANWVLIRPVPGVGVDDGLGIVLFARDTEFGYSPSGVSYLNHADLLDGVPAIGHLAGYQETRIHVAADGTDPRTVTAEFVMADYFATLGMQPLRGRLFVPDDERAADGITGVVISDRLWATLFQRSERLDDMTVRVNGRPAPVVGVAAAEYRGLERLGETDIWLPGASFTFVNHWTRDVLADRSFGQFHWFVARLAPGATYQQAQDQLSAATLRLAEAYPDVNAKFEVARPTLTAGIGIHPRMQNRVRETISLLAGGVTLVLLLACANVANLMVFRSIRLRGETAVRRALGAPVASIARYHLVESVLLAVFGAAAGLAVATGLSFLFEGTDFVGIGVVENVSIDWRVLGFTFAVSVTTGLVFGVAPALVASRIDFAAAVKSASNQQTVRRPLARQTLSVVQLGAATTLLIGAFLLIGTVRHLLSVDLGFNLTGVTTFHVNPGDQGYSSDQSFAYHRDLQRRLAGLSGTTHVAVSDHVPLGFTSFQGRWFDPAQPVDTLRVSTTSVSGGLFATMGVPLVAGREFTVRETFDEVEPIPVIVSDTLARALFGQRAAVGRTMHSPRTMGGPEREHLIVGVVADNRWGDIEEPASPMVFLPLKRSTSGGTRAFYSVRSVEPTGSLAPRLRRAAAAIDPSLPLTDVRPLTHNVDRWLADRRLLMRMLTVLATIAVTLAGIGLYGVVSFGVAERTRELGIRIAMGADRRKVLDLVLGQAARIAGLGVLVGLVGAYGLTQWLESRLFGVAPLDPTVYVLAVACLAAIGLAAGIAPARAATRVDPVVSLRSE